MVEGGLKVLLKRPVGAVGGEKAAPKAKRVRFERAEEVVVKAKRVVGGSKSAGGLEGSGAVSLRDGPPVLKGEMEQYNIDVPGYLVSEESLMGAVEAGPGALGKAVRMVETRNMAREVPAGCYWHYAGKHQRLYDHLLIRDHETVGRRERALALFGAANGLYVEYWTDQNRGVRRVVNGAPQLYKRVEAVLARLARTLKLDATKRPLHRVRAAMLSGPEPVSEDMAHIVRTAYDELMTLVLEHILVVYKYEARAAPGARHRSVFPEGPCILDF